MLRPAFPHPSATAQQPNLVALKTHLFISAIVWFPGLLARLLVFHFLFLVHDIRYRVLSLLETGLSRGSDSLARQGYTYSN